MIWRTRMDGVEVARVSLVDMKGRVILDTFVVAHAAQQIQGGVVVRAGLQNQEAVDCDLVRTKARVSLVDTKGRVMLDTQGAADVEEVACCSRPLEAQYSVPNRECSGGNKSRIPPNADYMGPIKQSRNGKEYCMDCFAAKDRRIQKQRYLKKRNEHDKFEEVTMMEEKLNAILEEQDGRILVRSVVGSTARKASIERLAPTHYTASFKKKYGQEVSYRNRTIAVFQQQNEVDQMFFMLFVHEYQRLADQKSWFVIDYLNSVKSPSKVHPLLERLLLMDVSSNGSSSPVCSSRRAFAGISQSSAHLNVIDTERWLHKSVYITIKRSSITRNAALFAMVLSNGSKKVLVSDCELVHSTNGRSRLSV
ncbi:unnamed protein product [Caenorhabditis nigoni]